MGPQSINTGPTGKFLEEGNPTSNLSPLKPNFALHSLLSTQKPNWSSKTKIQAWSSSYCVLQPHMSFPFSSEEKPKSLHWPTGIIWSHLVTLLCHLLSSSGFHLPPVSGTYQPYFYFHWLILLPKTLFHRGILPNSLIFLIFCWLYLSPTPSPCLLCLIFTILLSTEVHTSILHFFHLFLPFFSSPSYLCGEGNGNPLQYFCLENSSDGGSLYPTVPGVTKSQTQLSDFTFTFILITFYSFTYCYCLLLLCLRM